MTNNNNTIITGTHIAYLHLCHRKLWLFANGIQMEHTSDLVTEGKLIDEYTYQDRANKWSQIEIEGIKVDYYDPTSQTIREVKKSNKREKAHIAQVKYYIYVMRRNNIPVSYALLEYPKIRVTEEVFLVDEEYPELAAWEEDARSIILQEECPAFFKKTICKYCAYRDFCFVDEDNPE